jgi:type II secretory pathway pseudopilin PulG
VKDHFRTVCRYSLKSKVYCANCWCRWKEWAMRRWTICSKTPIKIDHLYNCARLVRLSIAAFTLAELLVCIGIVVLLMAILIPAIQKVREAANKMICASNLRQLGIAAHNYHLDYSCFPRGYLGPSLAHNTNYPANLFEGQWIGHLPLLLPYLERDKSLVQLRVNFNPLVTTREPWWRNPGLGLQPQMLRTMGWV